MLLVAHVSKLKCYFFFSFASYFWAYDVMKRTMAEQTGSAPDATWIALTAGGLSGIAACISELHLDLFYGIDEYY
jgi:hypothetical protein